MRATKRSHRAGKSLRPRAPRGKAAGLAGQVLALRADQVDAFVDALLPGADVEFREDLSDLIVIEQRKDEPIGRTAEEVFAELRAKDIRRS